MIEHPQPTGAPASRPAAPLDVSVVIPTRNRWPRLRLAVGGALAQDGVRHEVIVVDDGSSDGTERALEAIGDPALRYVRLASRHGVARARNIGLAHATGTWTAFMDDDDLWAPRKLRAQIDAADAAGATAVCAGVADIDVTGEIRIRHPPPPATITRDLLVRSVVPGGCSNVVARTELVRAVGGFDERLAALADWDLWIRLALAGAFAAVDEVLVGYMWHGGNMVVAGDYDLLGERRYLRDKYLAERRRHGVDIDPGFRWMARGHLLGHRRRDAVRYYLRAALAYRSPAYAARAGAALLGPRMWNMLKDGRNIARGARSARPLPPELAWLERYSGAQPLPRLWCPGRPAPRSLPRESVRSGRSRRLPAAASARSGSEVNAGQADDWAGR